jgi:hypothetical protein
MLMQASWCPSGLTFSSSAGASVPAAPGRESTMIG